MTPGLWASNQVVRRVIVSENEDLIERCQKGDQRAFMELFQQHNRQVARLAARMLGNSSDLEDIIQEVFLQVYRSIGEFKGRARFSTWLYRVTVNVVLMHRRAARSRPILTEVTNPEAPVDFAPRPDEEVARLARLAAFRRVLEQVSEKKRTVFILHEIEGLGSEEISNIVGAPVLTVRTRLFYARREIAKLLSTEPTLEALAAEVSRNKKETA